MDDLFKSIGVPTGVSIPVAFIVWAWYARRASSAASMEEVDRCPECGYDLRGGHRRCPEYGTDVTPEALLARKPRPDFDVAKLERDWPPDAIGPEMPGDGEFLTVVLSTSNGWIASQLQEHLMARGVWCRLEQVEREEIRGGIVGPAIFHPGCT